MFVSHFKIMSVRYNHKRWNVKLDLAPSVTKTCTSNLIFLKNAANQTIFYSYMLCIVFKMGN